MSVDRIIKMEEIQNEALELFRKNNVDYDDIFATYGSVGVIIRIGDKIKELVNVQKNGISLVNDGCLRDTLIDLQNYAGMAIMLLDENKVIKTNNRSRNNSSEYLINPNTAIYYTTA